MTDLALVTGIRDVARRHHILIIAYISFLSLILIIPNPQIYRWTYYAVLLPAFVLTVDRSTLVAVTQSAVWRIAVALLLCLWVSVLWGENPNLPDALDFARRALMIALFITITASLSMMRPGFSRLLFRCLLVVGATVAIGSFVWQVMQAGGQVLHRPYVVTIPNPNSAGAVYGAVIMGALFYALPEPHSAVKRYLVVAALVVIAVFVGLTQSRGNLVSLGFGLLVLAVLAQVREAAVALVVGVATILILLASGFLDWEELIARGLSYRVEGWRHFVGIWQQHPWLGIGANVQAPFVGQDGSAIVLSHPYNLYLSPLVSGGIPAFSLFVAMFAAAARAAWRAHRQKGDIGLLAMLIFVGLAGMVEFALLIDDADWQWLLFWLPIGLIIGAQARSLSPPPGAASRP